MVSGFLKPDLSANGSAMAREKKVNDLLVKWYETVVQGPPPPTNDPNLLRYDAKTDYYYMWSFTFETRDETYDIPWVVPPKVSVDEAAVQRVIASSLTDTMQNPTGEGYGTCVIKSFEGKYNDEACLFKLIVVAISFNFPASEYQTPFDVSAFGYWIYFFRAGLPFRSGDQEISELIHMEPFAYKVAPDMSIVGLRYMTIEELDQYNP